MHARVEHLLSLRDGLPVAADVQSHVRSCAECGSRLADLADVRAWLASLPAVDGGPDGWATVQSRMAARRGAGHRRRRLGYAAAAAAVAVLAVAGAMQIHYLRDGAQAARPAAAISAGTQLRTVARLEQLRAQSQELERVLASLPSRPAVEQAGMSLPIDSLEAQVQWLDHRLSTQPDVGASRTDEEKLWRERVEVMNSLVRLRYAEAQRVVL